MRPGLSTDIVDLTCEHLILVGIAMAIAIAISVPAGILLTRRAALRPWVLGFANIMQTVPSLALFGFLIPVPVIGGIGKRTAIVALVLYALSRAPDDGWTSANVAGLGILGLVLFAEMHSVLAYFLFRQDLAGLYLVTFSVAVMSQPFAPAEGPLLPLLVRGEQLITANSLFQTTFMVSQAAGFAVGPILIGVLGISKALFVLAALFGVAAFSLLFLPPIAPAPRSGPGHQIWGDDRKNMA